jgi:endonuclease YncB( thermonuclease family)
MKKILTILALLPALALAQVVVPKTTKTPAGVMYTAKILRVSDGDTVVIAAPYLPAPLKPELAVRIYGVDTPEKGYLAKCQAEKDMGELASLFTKAVVAASTQRQVTLYTWDKYGGRVLGDVILDGNSLRQALIAKGYAREYYGTAKQSWCN